MSCLSKANLRMWMEWDCPHLATTLLKSLVLGFLLKNVYFDVNEIALNGSSIAVLRPCYYS